MFTNVRQVQKLSVCRIAGLAAFLAWTGHSVTVSAQDVAEQAAASEPDIKSSFAINDEDPESTVPSQADAMKRPLDMGYYLMGLADRGDAAAARGDHSLEAKYYRAMSKAVPERAIGYRKACAAHDKAGERQQAVEMCRKALGAGGVTLQDHLLLVGMLLKRPGTPSTTEVADADAVLARLEGELKLGADEAGRKTLAEMRCQLGSKLEDRARLSVCTKQLRELKAQPAKIFTYDWALAIAQGDLAKARVVMEQAKTAGLPQAALEAMERGLSLAKESPAAAPSNLRTSLSALIIALSVVLVAFGAFRMRRRGRLDPV